VRARASTRASALVAEAGTGVGKTFAYLVPLLLSARARCQHRDQEPAGPAVPARPAAPARRLRVPVRVALLKGARSYLCLHRLQQARQARRCPTASRCARCASRAVGAAHRQRRPGRDRGLDERSRVIPLVTSTRDNCLGSECPSTALPRR
jgi:ATP-dependent DNA helicase DinG